MKLRNFPFIRSCWELNFIIIFNFYFYVFIFRDREGEKEGEEHQSERETLISCLSQAPGPGTEMAASACSLTGNQIHYLPVMWWCSNQQKHTGQGSKFVFLKTALDGVAQWIECQPANQKVLVQSGHMPGLQARSPGRVMPEATNQCFSHTLMFLSLSLKSTGMSSGED